MIRDGWEGEGIVELMIRVIGEFEEMGFLMALFFNIWDGGY